MYDRIIFTFSNKCNLHCPFCYGYFDGKEVVFENCLEIVKRCYENGLRRISFAGGDPLLVKEIDQIVDFACGIGMEVSMDTNAQLFDINKHSRMIEKLKTIAFPLDGPNAEIHDYVRRYIGNFDKVVNAIELLKKDVCIRINTVVTKSNYKHLYQQYDFLKQFAIAEWHIYECIPLIRGYINYDSIYIEYDNYKDIIERILKEKPKFLIEHSRIQQRIKGHLYVSSAGLLYTNDFININKYNVWGSVFENESFIKAFNYLKSGEL